MADIEWQDIDIQIGSMNEGFDKRILPPGNFVSVVNGDYAKPGTIRKRPGITRRVTGLTYGMQGNRLIRWNNQVFAADSNGAVRMRHPNLNSKTYANIDPRTPSIPTATVRQRPIITDLTQNLLADHGVTSNGFAVYATIGVGGNTSANIRVVEIASGSVVLDQPVALSWAARWVRAAASGNQVLVTYGDRTGSHIHGVIVDCATTVPLIISGGGTSITIVSDESLSYPVHDTVGLTVTTGRWALLYRNTSNALRLLELQYSGGTITTVTGVSIETGGTPSHFSVITANSGNDIVVNWRNANADWRYAVRNQTTFTTVVLAPTIWLLTTAAKTPITSGIGRFPNVLTGVDDFLLFASEMRDSATDQTPVTTWINANRTGTIGGDYGRCRRLVIIGKPWNVGSRQHAWCLTRQGVAPENYTYIATLCSFHNKPDHSDITASAGALRAHVETTAFFSAAPYFLSSSVASFGDPIAPTSYSIDSNGVYRCLVGVQYVPFELRHGPYELQVRYNHLGRYGSVEFGGSTYIAGGTVTEWDGARLREVGTVHAPSLSSDITLGGGGTWTNSFPGSYAYQYVIVYEYVDSLTQRHVFLRSNPTTATITAATDAVRLIMDPLTLTRAQIGTSILSDTPRVYITIYRTQANGTVFQRLFKFANTPSGLVNDPASLDSIIYSDTGAVNSSNEILFAESGELENDLVYGGATAICVHKDRVWLGGGADPEIVWYSKPRVDGRPAEFSAFQTFRVPGEEIVALGSLDEALIVFCTRGVYAVFGDGPDATGAGRPFDAPVKVNADSACNGPRSVVEIPQGLMFQTRSGLYLIDHKRQITYIGEPIKDTIKFYPVVRGVANNAARGEVMYALSDVSGTAGKIAVYNYLQGLWAVWEHRKRTTTVGPDDAIITTLVNDPTPWADIAIWQDREPIFLAQNGNLYEQQATANVYSDDLLFYPLDVETGWLSFGRLQGYKRIRKAGVLLERFNVHGLELSMKFGYNESYSTSMVWNENQITGIGAVEWLRVTVPRQKTPAIRLRVKELEDNTVTEVGSAADTPGFAIDGFNFQVGMIPGLWRLPASQSG